MTEDPRSGGTPAAAPAELVQRLVALVEDYAPFMRPQSLGRAEICKHETRALGYNWCDDCREGESEAVLRAIGPQPRPAGALSGVAPEPSEAAIDAVCDLALTQARDMIAQDRLTPDLPEYREVIRARLRVAYAIDGAAGRGSAGPTPKLSAFPARLQELRRCTSLEGADLDDLWGEIDALVAASPRAEPQE